jgi:hypothetical protein
MSPNTTEIERAVARSLRDSLEKLQHTTEEVHQAIGDLVSACSSARPSNSLPHLLRAQTAAASLAATLDVLSRFITSALQPGWSAPMMQQNVAVEPEPEPEPVTPVAVRAAETSTPIPVTFRPSRDPEPVAAAVEEALRTVASETQAFEQAAVAEPAPAVEPRSKPIEPSTDRRMFEVAALPPEEQELHRRANRVAKVSMQDIKMLRPADVQLGKENNDLCLRLRDDIERAHKEYERRFHAILDHPVDYFYSWMVEILGEGDPRALGEYPYPSPVVRR